MPSKTEDNKTPDQVGSTVAEETTRIDAIVYLEGATGHGVFSLCLLVCASVALMQERVGVAVVVGLIAFGVSLHGLSIYVWDALRLLLLDRFERGESRNTRTLTPHQVPPEMKAEMLSGAIMVSGLSILLGLLLWLGRSLTLQQMLSVSFASLAGGNFAGIAWSYIRS